MAPFSPLPSNSPNGHTREEMADSLESKPASRADSMPASALRAIGRLGTTIVRHFTQVEPTALALTGRQLKRCPLISLNSSMLLLLIGSLIATIAVDLCQTLDHIVPFPTHNTCRLLAEPGVIRLFTTAGTTVVNETLTLNIVYNDGCAAPFNVSASPVLTVGVGAASGLSATNIRSLLECAAPNAIYLTFDMAVSLQQFDLCRAGAYGFPVSHSLLNRGINNLGLEIEWCPLDVSERVYCTPTFADSAGFRADRALAMVALNKSVTSGLRRFDHAQVPIDACANVNGLTVTVINSTSHQSFIYSALPANGLAAFGATDDGQYICPEEVCTSKYIQFGSFLGFYQLLVSITILLFRWSPCLYKIPRALRAQTQYGSGTAAGAAIPSADSSASLQLEPRGAGPSSSLSVFTVRSGTRTGPVEAPVELSAFESHNKV